MVTQFRSGKIPDAIPLHGNSDKKTYEVRGKLICSVDEIVETQEFKGVKLLLPSERGRITRRRFRRSVASPCGISAFLGHGTRSGGGAVWRMISKEM